MIPAWLYLLMVEERNRSGTRERDEEETPRHNLPQENHRAFPGYRDSQYHLARSTIPQRGNRPNYKSS